MSEETIERAHEVVDAPSPDRAVTTLDPLQKIEAGLAQLREEAKPIDHTKIATVPAVDKAARAFRLRCVTLRTSIDGAYDTVNRPLLDMQRSARALRDKLKADVLALEAPVDEAIKASEAAAEERRRQKAEAERLRLVAIRRRIADISEVAHRAVGRPASDIEEAIRTVTAIDDWEQFGELRYEAETTQAAALTSLRDLLTRTQAHEAEVARLAAERAELERQRAEREDAERAVRERALADQRAIDEVHKWADELEQCSSAAISAAIVTTAGEHERIAGTSERVAEAIVRARRRANAYLGAAQQREKLARDAAAQEQRRAEEQAELQRQREQQEQNAREQQARLEAERQAEEQRQREARQREAAERAELHLRAGLLRAFQEAIDRVGMAAAAACRARFAPAGDDVLSTEIDDCIAALNALQHEPPTPPAETHGATSGTEPASGGTNAAAAETAPPSIEQQLIDCRSALREACNLVVKLSARRADREGIAARVEQLRELGGLRS